MHHILTTSMYLQYLRLLQSYDHSNEIKTLVLNTRNKNTLYWEGSDTLDPRTLPRLRFRPLPFLLVPPSQRCDKATKVLIISYIF